MNEKFIPPWETTEWKKSASQWIDDQLTILGLRRTGEIEQIHVQPWSTVLRVPTATGDLYFKAGGPTQKFEPALLRLLNDQQPDDVLPLLAADVERGWSLLPDGTQTLRKMSGGNPDVGAWKQVLPVYAQLQIASTDWRTKLISLGVPDRQLPDLHRTYLEILTDAEVPLIGKGEDALTAAQHERLLELAPVVKDMLAELQDLDIPAALEHGDLHDANIFVQGSGYRIFDWDDAAVTHPFFTLLLPIRFTAYKFGIEEYDRDPRLLEIRDAYLKPWTDIAPFEKVVKAWELARHLAKFVRTINWYRVVKTTEAAEVTDYANSVSGWFLDFLNHPTSRF